MAPTYVLEQRVFAHLYLCFLTTILLHAALSCLIANYLQDWPWPYTSHGFG